MGSGDYDEMVRQLVSDRCQTSPAMPAVTQFHAMEKDMQPIVAQDRRAFLGYFAGIGLGGTLLPGVLWAKVANAAEVTDAHIVAASEIAGVSFTEAERAAMLRNLKTNVQAYATLQKLAIDNAVSPAVRFSPLPSNWQPPTGPSRPAVRAAVRSRAVPSNLEELAFEPVTVLGELVRTRKVSSTALTKMYLERLKRYNDKLRFVVNFTEERALAQAAAADQEIARGKYRGPLHGIPWGAKDLLAVKGYPTTWGATPLKDQMLPVDATVVQRLDAAGAVLVAKLTLGALAQGDRWFGGQTKNPWAPDTRGSSGSSAGSASSTAAGCVGFSLGTETRGSISSPSSECGATGLRPTFGRVPRTGAMALSWSMDKIGPICRSVEDTALVLAAIHGPDGQDLSTVQAPFNWDATMPLTKIRVGYVKSAFEAPPAASASPAAAAPAGTPPARQSLHPFDVAALDTLRKLGITLVPVELPPLPYSAMDLILTAECGAAFDEYTRSGKANAMGPEQSTWPNTFRGAQFILAVEYIQANRLRTQAIEQWAAMSRDVDVIVVPTNGANQVSITNLTGHPACILPHGFRDDGTPGSITFLGGLYGEAAMLRVAHAFQQATNFHLKHPVLG